MTEKKHTVKKVFIILGIVVLAFALLLIINFIPTWNLKTPNMQLLEGKWINVYYETEKSAAEDVFNLADKRAAELAELLGVTEKCDINIYIYDDQKVMQRKKYGLIAPLLGLDWYIGDNIGTNVILTSPANPGPVHDYENNKQASLHEIVHAYNSVINPDMSYWYDNGLAGFLSGQVPGYPVYRYNDAPTLQQIKSNNLLTPIIFANYMGYEFSYTYVEFLNEKFGWEAVTEFAKTGDFKAFGCTEEEIYNQWIGFLENNYYNE